MDSDGDALIDVEGILTTKFQIGLPDNIVVARNPIFSLKNIPNSQSHDAIMQHLKKLHFRINDQKAKIIKDKTHSAFRERGFHFVFGHRLFRFKCRFEPVEYRIENGINYVYYLNSSEASEQDQIKLVEQLFRGLVIVTENTGKHGKKRTLTVDSGIKVYKDEFVDIKIYILSDGNLEQ